MSRFLTAKVAVATLTTVIAVGGVATATTVAKNASEHAKAVRDLGKPDKAHGPDATGPSKDGLCRAWASGNGRDNGGREDSVAFQALIAAAGGEDKVDAYCAATTSTSSTAAGKGAAENANGQRGDGGATTGACKAWAEAAKAGNATAQRQRMGASAFESLAKAAGGEANIPAYCAAAIADKGPNGPSSGAQDQQGAADRGPASQSDGHANQGDSENKDTSTR